MNPRSRYHLDALLARINETLGRTPQMAVELAHGNKPVNFEELKPDSLRSAMVWDIDTQVARYHEACSRLLWAPELGRDNGLLRDAIYARTALRVSGLNTVIN